MPDISVFHQSPTPRSDSQEVERTNSLVITQVPRSFFQPLILDVLRDHFATYGEINQWVPISSFSRIIVVYFSEESAEKAKLNCDPLVIDPAHDGLRSPTIIRVYRSNSNPIILSTSSPTPDDHLLRPPEIEKNFLISPPGSPPVGWEQIKEDPPNSSPLAEDLIAALRKLKMHERGSSSREVLLEPEEGVGVGVYVEDCDVNDASDGEEQDWAYGELSPARLKWIPQPTALPPLPVA